MLRIKEIAFTGYPVTNMSHARNFYENVLGLKASHVGGDSETSQWVEYDIGSATLAISNIAEEWKPSSTGPSVALEVEDFDSAIAWLKSQHVNFSELPFETPVCHMTTITDPDGNSIIIHRRKDKPANH